MFEPNRPDPTRDLEPLIGNTPLLAIQLRFRGEARVLFAKSENLNMTGSVKDRMALEILRRAYRTGALRPGALIVEATSGNTGISFAAIGDALGLGRRADSGLHSLLLARGPRRLLWTVTAFTAGHSVTLSLAAVFIPVLFMGGLVGRLLKEFAVTIMVAVLVSGVVSLTLTPMLCSRFLRPPHGGHNRLYQWSERVFDGMLRLYDRTLQWSLRHHRFTMAVFLLTLLGTVWCFAVIPTGFIPTEDNGTMFAFTEASQDISFEAMAERQQAAAKIVREHPHVQQIVSFIGASGSSTVLNNGRVFALLKPRVMSLVVFTALVGMAMAPAGLHPAEAVVALIAIAAGAGAAGALNMWYEADIDALMRRTAHRPIPAGQVAPQDALAFGVALAGFSVMVLGLAANWLAAGLLAFTIFFYVVVYSMWLKRSTPQNIVIGGAAGAVPPLVGYAAATGDLTLTALFLFAIVFVWTPPHFWALALLIRREYEAARVPMLPVVRGERATTRQILVYTAALVALTLVPVFGWLYLGAAAALGAGFLWLAWRLREHATPRLAALTFHYSLAYLALLFVAMAVDPLV